MHVAGLAFGLLFAAFLVHLLIWRVRVPRRQTAALLIIFMSALPLGLAIVALVPPLRQFAPTGTWQYLHVGIFHIGLALAYINGYSLLEDRSPTLTMVTFVADGGEQGRTLEEIVGNVQEAVTVDVRLAAMIRDKMLVEDGQSYCITPKGRAWAAVFSIWLRVLGIERGS
jgi:hypothetical protein